MKASISLTISTIIAALCLAAMLAVTLVWMYLPARIIYQESSPVKTKVYSIEVREHGQAFYLTSGQKQMVDLIHFYTPVIWFACCGYLFLFTALGGFERLRLLKKRGAVNGPS